MAAEPGPARQESSVRPLSLLIDTNVLLDVVLLRQPWDADGVRLLDAVGAGRARGFVASHAVTTLHYLVARELGKAAATQAVSDVLQTYPVVPLGTNDLQRALTLGIADYEDAVHAAAGLAVGADYIVTRNERDFRPGPIPPRSPAEVLALL